jgi:hypothetical protein
MNVLIATEETTMTDENIINLMKNAESALRLVKEKLELTSDKRLPNLQLAIDSLDVVINPLTEEEQAWWRNDGLERERHLLSGYDAEDHAEAQPDWICRWRFAERNKS